MKVYARVLDGRWETTNYKIDGTLNELTDSARQVPDVGQVEAWLNLSQERRMA